MGFIEKGVATATNTLGQVSDSVGDLVSSKKQFITKQIINVVLLLIILLVFGCFDFLHLVFHFEYFLNANYWFDVGIKAVADICSYNIGVNFIIDEVIKNNKILAKLKETYEKLNALKENDFDDFLFEYNRDQKVIAYKNKITHRIYRLNKYAKRADKIEYNRLIKRTDCTWNEVKNRYCIKRHQLELLRTDEYIKQNIETLNVNYKDVDSAVFEIEINGTQKIIKNQVTGSVSKGRAIASSTTLLGVVVGSMVIRSISLAPNQQEFENQMIEAAHYAMKMASDIAIIIWQFLRGVLGTHNIVSQQITTPLSERVTILKKYYAWRQNKGLKVPKCYLELTIEKEQSTKNNDYIEVEMTQEEYENLKK